MSTRVIEQVDDWDEQPFSGGYRGLHDLADRDFSGVVRAGGAELFMTKGTVVGIHRGTIDDFEDASGTCYEAPTPALPLLAVMQDRNDEVRGEYYTEETSISAVDRTLEDGNFTGFVELSENVLSGDYFVVYHQGRSMSVAYVGASGQLLHGDEAFDRADDEVGIYQVRPVDIEPIEIPEPEPEQGGEPESGSDPESEPGDETEDESVDEAGDESVGEDTEGTSESEAEATAESESETGEETAETEPSERADADEASGPDGDEAGPDASAASAEDETPSAGSDAPAAGETGSATGDGDADAETPETDEAGESGTAEAESETPTEPGEEPKRRAESGDDTAQQSDRAPERSGDADRAEGRGGSVGVRERDDGDGGDGEPLGTPTAGESESGSIDLETRSIPSLDPERTSTAGEAVSEPEMSGDRTDTNGTGRNPRPERPRESGEGSRPAESQSRGTTEPDSGAPGRESTADRGAGETPEGDGARSQTGAADTDRPQGLNEELADARARLQEVTSERDELRAERDGLIEERDSLAEERDELQAELEAVREERDELRDEIERLEDEIATGDAAGEMGASTGRELTGTEALSGTDLFVRYHTKSDATLEKAHDGTVSREDVRENLRLEKHTQFDAESISIDGRAYDEFIEERVEYRFVTWVIRELLFEIQNTGQTDALRDLYDALPRVNRIELDGAVSVAGDGGEETEELFDVVFRERMGDPLFVADVNHSRQGASQGMMERLVTSAERVGRTSDEFAAAFLVTESFFEPEALETVSEATQSGLLSRNKRASFVNLSRKQGYHLCLVEARNENFHLEVPEL